MRRPIDRRSKTPLARTRQVPSPLSSGPARSACGDTTPRLPSIRFDGGDAAPDGEQRGILIWQQFPCAFGGQVGIGAPGAIRRRRGRSPVIGCVRRQRRPRRRSGPGTALRRSGSGPRDRAGRPREGGTVRSGPARRAAGLVARALAGRFAEAGSLAAEVLVDRGDSFGHKGSRARLLLPGPLARAAKLMLSERTVEATSGRPVGGQGRSQGLTVSLPRMRATTASRLSSRKK